MTVDRRRFLAIAASFAATPAVAQRHSWAGRAFGAAVSIELHGPRDVVAPALAEVQMIIAEVEALFSLYDPTSQLVRLNRAGSADVTPRFLAVMQIASQAHAVTDGLFDPTVQPLWQALSEGEGAAAARDLIGWDRVRVDGPRVTLGPGQALTFNGIAQGFATDLVSERLRAHGFDRTLVNIGEFRGSGGPWRLGIADPVHGLLATRTLETGAIATSSPQATPLGTYGHILHRDAVPRWSTVSVEAESAAMADALSTGLTLATRAQIAQARTIPGLRRITLVDQQGNVTSV